MTLPIKDILVHVDDHPNVAARLDGAAALAERFDAHLAAVYARIEADWQSDVYGQLPNDTVEVQQKRLDAARDKAREAVAAAQQRSGRMIEFRELRTWPRFVAWQVTLSARHADLVVLGQADTGKPQAGGPELPEEVALYAGRPVLMIPYIGFQKPIGGNVLVAWDGSREAARAVGDALPLLLQAKRVTVLTIDAHKLADRPGEIPGADIAAHLARHGIKAEARQITTDGMAVADLLLDRVSDLDIDLVVMGAYGHSRLRELALGGVSYSMFAQMTVPVLMSH